jgi:ankyrin repeat protein
MLPVDSSLKADDEQILTLLHKTATGGKMDAFRILLPNIQSPHNYRIRTELHSLTIIAAQVGSISAVKLLCLNYRFCLEQTKQGRSVLVQVARANSYDETFTLASILREFLEMGLYVSTQEPDGYTALHVVAEKGDLDAVKLLLSEGACPSLPNAQGKRPLDLARGKEVLAVLTDAVSSSPSPQEVSLYHAADLGDIGSIEHLVHRQPPVSINTKWVHGRTAISAAARVGDRKMVDFLLSLGASPIPLGCYWADLPAMIAMMNGHDDIARTLIQRTEDYILRAGQIEKKNIKLQLVSLLHHCCRVGATGVANMVLNSRVNINPNTEFRHHLAPIHVAARHGQLSTMKVLIAHNADVTLPTEVYRNTPLHYACFYGHLNVAKFLLSLEQVDPNCMNIQHETPLFCVLRCQLTPNRKNSFVREDSVICLLLHHALLVKPGRIKCEYQDFNMEVAGQRWNFLPVETQKLIVVLREERKGFPSLASQCRLVIRGAMQCPINEESVGNTGLPFRLQHYVLLKDWFPT